MNRNVERGAATRAHLVDVATRLFTERGYDGTSIEAVLAGSGVSRGSLYHHFPGKDALFWAVLEGVSARVGQQLVDAERDAPDPVAALRVWCLEWIRSWAGSGGESSTNRPTWAGSGPPSGTPPGRATSSGVT